ncbi:MAG: alpha-isopropylmalate synthase regulatory domain-containing protein [Myxococcota bacterium]|nr:alpha-isopropylmalate synthase regulatory domain-containing protein [Myxococcota bacterium]
MSPSRRSDPSPTIAVMDTTLRDGEQTPDVAYSPAEKRQLARLLLCDVEVDRIEIASTRVSEGERTAATGVAEWARKQRMLPRVEILGYTDGKASVDWIAGIGGKVLNLLTKGSERHCRTQLGMSPEQHRNAVETTIRYAARRRIAVNVYLEDWSSGVRESFDYVFAMVQHLRTLRIARIYLADTLGILAPEDVTRYVGLMTSTWPEVEFEFHAHNDYALATANCLAALKSGARGVHTSVNGMGERAGNTRLAEVVAAIHDHTDLRTAVNESRLVAISQMVATFSGKEMSGNTPVIGRDVFTQTAGIHADGDAKGELYGSRLAPQRFGRARRYALGKLSGKASVDHNLKALGIELSPDNRDLVLQKVIELGDRKHTVSQEDLPYIIADVLKSPTEQLVHVDHYHVDLATGRPPRAEIQLSYRGRTEKAEASGDGGYDALMQALRKAAKPLELELARLTDYRVRIPPGGKTGALVETLISWASAHSRRSGEAETFTTTGVDSDQMAAAVIATEKMLNAVIMRSARPKRPGKAGRAPAKKRSRSSAR